MKKLILSTAILLSLADPALANVKVTASASYETAPGMKVGAATLTLQADHDDRLVGASSPAADRVEIHSMTVDQKGVMQMRKVDGLDLPAGKAVTLEPSSYHLMLIGLKQPLKAGESLPLTLEFSHEKPVDVTVEVKSRKPQASPAHGGPHDAMKMDMKMDSMHHHD